MSGLLRDPSIWAAFLVLAAGAVMLTKGVRSRLGSFRGVMLGGFGLLGVLGGGWILLWGFGLYVSDSAY